ncbi:MAG: hypothetical protein CMB68_03905 [Euryarchaeota archaeon]|nr:hypothetical protein [Euryarchaeota archaeon]|tara:strand:+ start:11167 stop:12579 length:1413 start_codon:yes stop_codon:yes gene_type:complete
MATGSMLQTSDLSVDRGSRAVLKEIDFKLSSGEIVALVGENGSGKTTMLEACAGILPLSGGSISRHSKSGKMQVVRDHEGRRNQPPPTGLTLQRDGICGEETVEERLEVALKVSGMEMSEPIASDILKEWGLEHRRADRVAQLSGGQSRRLAVLCGLAPAALSAESRVVMLDEPSEGLDRTGKELLIGWLRGLKLNGHSVMVATHDQSIIDCSDRIIEVRNGNLNESNGVSEGTPSDLPGPLPSVEPSTHGALIRWAIKMETRNPLDTTGRAAPALVALLLSYALIGEIDMTHVGNDLVAALVLAPAFITAVISPALTRRLAEERCGAWWNAMIGPSARQTYSFVGASIILPLPITYLAWIILVDPSEFTNHSEVTRWLWLPALIIIDVAAAAAALHLLVADLRRASAAAASLLLLVLIWPFLQLTDALSLMMSDGMTFGLSIGDPLISCLIASLISAAVWAVAVFLPDA